MLLAAGILTWMIFWMSRQARYFKSDLESGVQKASQAGKWSLFGLAFLAVLREGVELALFLAAAAFSSQAPQTAPGALFGLGTAALLGWLLFCNHPPVEPAAFLPGDRHSAHFFCCRAGCPQPA